ncbi:MAG: ATP-binding protein [Anaerolineae bacterium]|nr:ATP-binding protein [Anaerolineae bacterium]
MTQTLSPWRTACTPHRDIREDAVSEALFAVNLSRAIAREGPEEYRDPRQFFARTHLTRTLQSLIRDVLNTLRGQPGANSVIHLQTNFGGGKTHAELALYHLLTAPEAALATPRVAGFLATLGITEPGGAFDMPKAAVAALPCADLDAGGREVGGVMINTLWGELAYRLGGAALYELIRESDDRRGAPGVVKLRQLLEAAGPNVILIDELLHYVDKAAAIKVTDSNLGSQTLAFARELTEAVDAVPHSILVASLTMSKMEDLQVLSTEDAHFTLARLEDIFRRVEDARTPIESAEIYDIVRARLFEQVDEAAAAQTAAAYVQFYRSDPWRDLLPPATREGGYEALLRQAYPFHPSIIQVLYERWGSRPQFQLTRGTLRFLAHLLAHLWPQELGGLGKTVQSETLIHLADVDLANDDVRAEAVRVAGSAWEAVIGADIAGADSGTQAIAQRLDHERGGLYARYGLHEGLATSVFMASHGGEQRKPTPQAEIRLAVAQPELPISDLNQAFDDCRARLYYYYDEEGGLLFKTEPNPNKVLADERANVTTDQARAQVERVVADVLGPARLFNVSYYDFQQGTTRTPPAKEPGDVPDDDALQLVVLPPRHTLTRGKASGRTLETLEAVAGQYAQRLRMNRNRLLFMAPDARPIASAVEQAMDWLAARNVAGDADLMARFSATQQDVVRDRVTEGENSTKDHVRKAYNTVLLPAASPPGDSSPRPAWEVVELGYIPPSKAVIAQAEEELLKTYKIHQQFNPALLEERWAALWPMTATVITTQALWEKFARRTEAPILAGPPVLQAMIRAGVEQGVFGYGVLIDDTRDKLQAASYERERVYFGPFDAAEMGVVELGPRGVLLRPGQVDALFPPVTPDEVAMLLHKARQSVNEIFQTARHLPTVKGRVDQVTFFAAVSAGVRVGLFGYAESADGAVQRGAGASLTPEEVAFTGWLIGEDTPLPLTAEELARLLPVRGRLAVEDLYAQAVQTYGAERVTEQGVLDLLQRILREGRCGYAGSADAPVRPGWATVTLAGYIGQPELPPPDTRIIRLRGTITPVEMANVMKTAMNLSRLSKESSITLALDLELKGEVNDHSVQMALKEIQGRVAGVEVEDVRGG